MKHLKALTLIFVMAFSLIATAQSDNAKIFIVRNTPGTPFYRPAITVNGEVIGNTEPMSYLEIEVTPGVVQINTARGRHNNILHLSVSAGVSYYIQQKIIPSPLENISKFKVFKPGKGERAVYRCRALNSSGSGKASIVK